MFPLLATIRKIFVIIGALLTGGLTIVSSLIPQTAHAAPWN